MAKQLVIGGEVIDDIIINDEASEIKCKDAEGNESNVQAELTKLNNLCEDNQNKNMIKYNSETDSLDVYEDGVFIGSVPGLGFKSTIKYYTHSSSGSTRTLTLSENWQSISSLKVISGPCVSENLTYNFTPPKTLNYTFSNSTGITSGSYTNVLAIQGKLA